jgi:hypothetical protein
MYIHDLVDSRRIDVVAGVERQTESADRSAEFHGVVQVFGESPAFGANGDSHPLLAGHTDQFLETVDLRVERRSQR